MSDYGGNIRQLPVTNERDLSSGGGDDTSGGMEGRVTRLEEWAKLSDQRAARVENKLDKLTDTVANLATVMKVGFAELRANTDSQAANMRAEFSDRSEAARRHQSAVSWTAAGTIVAVIAALLTLYTLFWPKVATHQQVAPPSPPQTIVIQYPTALQTKPK